MSIFLVRFPHIQLSFVAFSPMIQMHFDRALRINFALQQVDESFTLIHILFKFKTKSLLFIKIFESVF